MPTSSDIVADAEHYRVYLLRLWRNNEGPWHASLQAADALAARRFADLEALIAFLRDMVPPPPAAHTASGEAHAEEGPAHTRATSEPI